MTLEGRRIPIGRARDLESKREVLPAIEVKNKVLWVNGNLALPFSLEVGHPTKLGMFLSSQTERVQDKVFTLFGHSIVVGRTRVVEPFREMEVKPWHGRSALAGRVVFSEKSDGQDPQLFRDIDIKGAGRVTYGGKNSDKLVVGEIRKMDDGGISGLLEQQTAYYDATIAEQFKDYGIRTHRVVAVIALEEIVYGGKKISVEEAQQEKLLPPKFAPVLEVRAFGTHARFIDAFNRRQPQENRDLLLADARSLVAQELGLTLDEFTGIEYARWLAETTGKNLGLMHKNGWVHGYLSLGHNITLDGCFVDFDSAKAVSESKEPHKYHQDYTDASHALEIFLRDAMNLDDKIVIDIQEEFARSYRETRENTR